MRFILNVGPPKTGTTSIQHFIRDNATELGDQGIFVPQTDAPNMREFSLACDVTGVFRPSERGQNRLQTLLNLTRENYFDRIDSIRERLRQQLSDALRSNRFHTVIISSENLAYLGSSGVDIDTKLGALKDFLAEFGESFRILFALRRQDLISISRYSTAIKGNNVQTHEELLVHSSGMDLVRVLDGWERTFGVSSVRPFIFPDSTIEKSNGLMYEFLSAANLLSFHSSELETKYWRNQTIDGRSLEAQRLLNTVFLAHPRNIQAMTKVHRRVETLLDKYVFEPPLQKILPSRSQVINFMKEYESINELVREKFFPDQESLFKNDFSKYPDHPIYPAPSKSDLLKLIALLIKDNRLN